MVGFELTTHRTTFTNITIEIIVELYQKFTTNLLRYPMNVLWFSEIQENVKSTIWRFSYVATSVS